MADLVTTLITFIDYQVVLTAVVLYVVAMWLMFCLWVFLDARKRYHSVWVALMFGVLVFIFTFPALIFYLVVRPEETFMPGAEGYSADQAGVNVPVINFISEDGEVEMAINLQVYKQSHPTADMKVRVDWDSQHPGMQMSAGKENQTQVEVPMESKVEADSRFATLTNKAKGSFKKMLEVSKKQVPTYDLGASESEDTDSTDVRVAEELPKQQNKKKKNKRK